MELFERLKTNIYEKTLAVYQISTLIEKKTFTVIDEFDSYTTEQSEKLLEALRLGIQPQKMYIIQHPETFDYVLVNPFQFKILNNFTEMDKISVYDRMMTRQKQLKFLEIEPNNMDDFNFWLNYIQFELNKI